VFHLHYYTRNSTRMAGIEDGFTLLGGMSYNSSYASADFQDAEVTRPEAVNMESLGGNRDAIQGIVQQSLTRHLTEALPPSASPSLSSYSTQTNNWRKRLREMMIRQNETVLGFLHRPPADHATIGPVEQALRRFAIREDIDNHHLKPLKHLLVDISGAQQIHEEIEALLASKGPSSQNQLKAQVNALIELYKDTGDKLLEAENQLKLRLEKMDKVQRRIQTVMELQTNEATPEVVGALEHYLQISFRDMNVESLYKSLLFLYQKHIALREAIAVFKTGSQLVSEPLCPICLTDSVTTAIVPCGHTFCNSCARRMAMECGVCRGRIRERMKLYFS
jgi:hypothetical protein